MKKYYLFGFVSGIFLAVLLIQFGFRQYYFFLEPTEAHVKIDGSAEGFRNDQFSEVNNFLGNSAGGRKAFVYPTSGSSYTIIYLPKKNKHLNRIEREEISRIIGEKMKY